MVKPFEGILGNNCELRIIEYLLPLEGVELNITELASEVGVSRPSADRVVKKFMEWGIMRFAGKRAGVIYYEINSESPFFRVFQDIDNALIERMLGEETLHEIHDYFIEHRPRPHPVTGLENKTSAAFRMPQESLWPGIAGESGGLTQPKMAADAKMEYRISVYSGGGNNAA